MLWSLYYANKCLAHIYSFRVWFLSTMPRDIPFRYTLYFIIRTFFSHSFFFSIAFKFTHLQHFWTWSNLMCALFFCYCQYFLFLLFLVSYFFFKVKYFPVFILFSSVKLGITINLHTFIYMCIYFIWLSTYQNVCQCVKQLRNDDYI